MARYQEDREAVTESGETLFPQRGGTRVWGNKIRQQGEAVTASGDTVPPRSGGDGMGEQAEETGKQYYRQKVRN